MSARLDLVIGCNGAGKSTLISAVLKPQLPQSPFINADVIAKERWPNDPEGKSYAAARIAEQLRNALIADRRSFIAETVFSHPSKLALIRRAQANGFLRARVYDNSGAQMRVIARFEQSIPAPGAVWPTWTPPEIAALTPTPK